MENVCRAESGANGANGSKRSELAERANERVCDILFFGEEMLVDPRMAVFLKKVVFCGRPFSTLGAPSKSFSLKFFAFLKAFKFGVQF